MKFIAELKEVAQDIIELSNTMADGVRTWEEQAKISGQSYKDRAGFLSYGDIELGADISLPSDQPNGLLRARLAAANDADAGIFTIITLHFNTDRNKAAELIKHGSAISRQAIAELLHEETTTPELIHVSLKSGTKGIGKRFEYSPNEIKTLSEEDRVIFIKTLREAFNYISNKTYSCEECGLHYDNELLSKECYVFCTENNACSIEITKNSVEAKAAIKKSKENNG